MTGKRGGRALGGRWPCLVFMRASVTHLTSRQVFGIFIEVIHVGAEGLEVWDHKLLPEGLGEQNDVALDTPRTGDSPRAFRSVRGRARFTPRYQ